MFFVVNRFVSLQAISNYFQLTETKNKTAAFSTNMEHQDSLTQHKTQTAVEESNNTINKKEQPDESTTQFSLMFALLPTGLMLRFLMLRLLISSKWCSSVSYYVDQ